MVLVVTPTTGYQMGAMRHAAAFLKEIEDASAQLPIDEAVLPPDFGVQLLPFQKQTVTWMVKRSRGRPPNTPSDRSGQMPAEWGSL